MKILVLTGETSLLGGQVAWRLAKGGHQLTMGFLSYAGGRVWSARGLVRQWRGSGPAFLAGKLWDQALLAWRSGSLPISPHRTPIFPVETAKRFSLPTLTLEDVNQHLGLEALRRAKPDILLTAGFGAILKQAAMEVPRLDAWNLHPSVLPSFPGPNPLRDMLAARATEGGVTLHRLSLDVDAGVILGQTRYPIPPGSGQRRILMLAARAGAELVEQALRRL